MSVADDKCTRYLKSMTLTQKDIQLIYSSIGERIVKLRNDKNMSQEKLASESKLDRSHIGFIEQGRRNPTVATLVKITTALECKLEDLFKDL